ncbi:hypothetical protein [Dysgonomonas sp. 511]|uniref:hypothetical protein n=1 Tax=Dysgonomonas sp. 511 TaxID=2302930 RepID=UPI0013D0A38E|nr:hypothetical protein [Dysgonomonas sp. 511]NDV78524.1 hypothetical protein [Dysgonomonas sp. 511]
MTITFETKCWEKDWIYILCKGYLEKMIDNCNYPFDNKVLFINNVKNVELVKKHAQKKVDKGIIDKYVIVEEYATNALEFFGIQKDDFKGGYYYSIAELVSIYLCKTDFLLHFSSDTCITKDNNNWVKNTLAIMNRNEEYFVANPVWNGCIEEAQSESFDETESNFIGFGFSDQCYLVRTKDFQNPIYNESNIASARYPEYGGELFEKRVDAYMRNHNLKRITSKNASYVHKNYKEISFWEKILHRFI